MINDARSYASLSSGLLARKGAAKPAMRPQGFGHHAGFDDLGWNDMGSHGGQQHEPAPEDVFEGDLPEHVPSSIAALTPAPKLAKAAPADAEEQAEPEVVAQQRAIAESFPAEVEVEVDAEDEAPPAPAQVVALPKRQALPVVVAGRKAAFTLRLDAERHLRLRLATAVTGRSAQQIVTGALDALLATIPELEALAERVPPATAKRN
ncbi:MAG TPA: hypothetical protein VGO55_06690 [Allosphingosinicella sp.]|jgi:hypothetical protein|nr:hypothetical protein [Allosphingosinicella sp.]